MHSPVLAQEWSSKVPVGGPFPSISATDQSGVRHKNEELPGKNGFLFLFNRSVVW